MCELWTTPTGRELDRSTNAAAAAFKEVQCRSADDECPMA